MVAGFGDDPKVERPTIENRCDQSARVDDRVYGYVRETNGRPIAVCQVHMAERKASELRDCNVVYQ